MLEMAGTDEMLKLKSDEIIFEVLLFETILKLSCVNVMRVFVFDFVSCLIGCDKICLCCLCSTIGFDQMDYLLYFLLHLYVVY